MAMLGTCEMTLDSKINFTVSTAQASLLLQI